MTQIGVTWPDQETDEEDESSEEEEGGNEDSEEESEESDKETDPEASGSKDAPCSSRGLMPTVSGHDEGGGL